MNRTVWLLWGLILTSIAAISVLAYLWLNQRQHSLRQRTSELLTEQLRPFNRDIESVFASYEVQLQRLTAGVDMANLSGVVELKSHPLVNALVVIDEDGRMLYPTFDTQGGQSPSLFADARQILLEQSFSFEGQQIRNNALKSYSHNSSTSGWTTWYHQRGIILAYWWQLDNCRAMVILPRARWIADLIAALPAQVSESSSGRQQNRLYRLLDVAGKVVYQWGNQPVDDEPWPARTQLSVASPLDSWRLQLMVPPNDVDSVAEDSLRNATAIAVVGMSIAFLLGGVLATMNIRRETRLASQRVSFVNHASHELRTPLTNILLYTDMLKDQLERDDSSIVDDQQSNSAKAQVEVICNESRRLSRMVANVLSLAESGMRQRPLRLSKFAVDDVIDDVLASFAPQLLAKSFDVQRQRDQQAVISSDRSALEQILVNLVGNAEKYASTGKFLSIACRLIDRQIEVHVQDHGPGIAAKFSERIFDPFFRISDGLEDPAGTGIGLAIARQLARQLGGDCRLDKSQTGACFKILMPIETATPGERI